MIQIVRHHPFTRIICVGAIALLNGLFLAESRAELMAQSGASLLEALPTVAPNESTPQQDDSSEQQAVSVAAYIKQGNQAYVEAEYDQAIEAYSQALELYNQNAYAYYNRGNANRKLKNNEDALRDYTLAVKFNPANHYAYYYRGMIFSEAKNYEQAIADFSQALELNDQIPTFYVERAETFTKLENKDAAKEDYKEAIKLYKKFGKDLKAELLQRKVGGVLR